MQRPAPVWYRWELMVLLWLTYFLHQIDRAIFGVLMKNIQDELHLTDLQIGFSAQIMFFVIAVMVPVAGYMGDRFSKKWIITGSLLFWSMATALTGTARGIIGIVAFRSVATGGGESFYGPASTAMIAAFHKKTRAIALSIHQSAVYIAPMLSGYLGMLICLNFGWRSTFYIFGGLGILMGLVLIWRLREPTQADERLNSTKASENESGAPADVEPEKVPFLTAVGQILRIPTALLLTVGFTAIVFVNNAYLQFAPKFIFERFHVSEQVASQNGMFMHFSAALIGVVAGGLLADNLVDRFKSFRLIMQSTVMLLGAPLIFLIGSVQSVVMLWVILFLFGLLRGLYESNTHAAVFDVVPPHLRATVVGLMLLFAMLIGSCSLTFFGYLGTKYGTGPGVALAFRIVSVTWVIGGLCVLSALLFTFKKDRLKQ